MFLLWQVNPTKINAGIHPKVHRREYIDMGYTWWSTTIEYANLWFYRITVLRWIFRLKLHSCCMRIDFPMHIRCDCYYRKYLHISVRISSGILFHFHRWNFVIVKLNTYYSHSTLKDILNERWKIFMIDLKKNFFFATKNIG